MINQIILVGRITEINSEDKAITLAVSRSFKDENGEYGTDYIKCKLFQYKATVVNEYCEKGDIIGIKGRVQSNGKKLEVVAEKVTFVSNKKKGEQ